MSRVRKFAPRKMVNLKLFFFVILPVLRSMIVLIFIVNIIRLVEIAGGYEVLLDRLDFGQLCWLGLQDVIDAGGLLLLLLLPLQQNFSTQRSRLSRRRFRRRYILNVLGYRFFKLLVADVSAIAIIDCHVVNDLETAIRQLHLILTVGWSNHRDIPLSDDHCRHSY